MFGTKRYDLRFKDLIWSVRDSFIGASLTDTKDIALMKKRMALNQYIVVGIIVAGAIIYALASK